MAAAETQDRAGADLSRNPGAFDRGGAEQAAQAGAEAAKDDGAQQPAITAAGGATSGDDARQLAAVAARRPVSGYIPEFLKRVTQEAKLILDGEKNEFVMQLKPESLGKVTMRIVTEHGSVSARFTVESESARSGLEENLGQLKDALNAQGLHIQGCMVEVRQGREQASRSGGFAEGNGRVRKAGRASGENVGAAAPDAVMRAFLRNRYYEQQSSVHYTA
jgi:flagellar hook-length control protein FliK